MLHVCDIICMYCYIEVVSHFFTFTLHVYIYKCSHYVLEFHKKCALRKIECTDFITCMVYCITVWSTICQCLLLECTFLFEIHFTGRLLFIDANKQGVIF